MMDSHKRKALEYAGWTLGDAADFLEMSDAERQLLDARIEFAKAIREQRQALHMSQKELGQRLKTSQPRVAKIERAAADVSLDQLVRAFTELGGKFRLQFDPKQVAKRNRTESKASAVKPRANRSSGTPVQ